MQEGGTGEDILVSKLHNEKLKTFLSPNIKRVKIQGG
jgi:hypothetical protein